MFTSFLKKKISFLADKKVIAILSGAFTLAAQNSATTAYAQTIVSHNTSYWSQPISLPLVPVAASSLPDGRILTWSAARKTDFVNGGGKTATSIIDLSVINRLKKPPTDTVVVDTNHDMFCPGTAHLKDGRIMITGGTNASVTTLYNPVTNKWSLGNAMNVGRGYHTMVAKSDGSVFTLGGSFSGGKGGKVGEVWRPGQGWSILPNIPALPFQTQDPEDAGNALTPFRADNHYWMFEAPNGAIFQAGPSRMMHWINLNGQGSYTQAGARGSDPDAMNGNAVMYDTGKILTFGGSTSYSSLTPATAKTHLIDINPNAPQLVRETASMAYARTLANGVVLPSGEVVVAGGAPKALIFSDEDAILPTEIWNPQTETWKTLANINVPRTYHSVAILLKDGRVMVGGGGLCGFCDNHTNVEVLTPPYLLRPNGQLAPRPKFTHPLIVSADVGDSIIVQMNTNANHSFALIRLSTVTHSVNLDQRRVPLVGTPIGNNNFRIDLPQNPSVILPGDYYLFAMNQNGVPSVAESIRITPKHEGPTSRVTLRDHHGKYVTANREGRIASQPFPGDGTEQFLLLQNNDGTSSLQSSFGFNWSSLPNGFLSAQTPWILPWEKFYLENNPNGTASFRSIHNKYVSSEPNGNVIANRNSKQIWEQFSVTTLPSSDRTHYGTVNDFWHRYLQVNTASNTVSASNTVANNNSFIRFIPLGGNAYALQSYDGFYLSATPIGTLEANRTAIQAWERFDLERKDDGSFSFRTFHGTYLSSQPDGRLLADRDQALEFERFRLSFE